MRPQGSSQVKELTGRVALVTGGAVRVGRAIAIALADGGADVAIGYRRSAAAARATTAHLTARGARAVAIAADLSDPAAIEELVARTKDAFGGFDIWVANADGSNPHPVVSGGANENPHWAPMFLINASCNGSSSAPEANPSMVVTDFPFASKAR